MMRNGVRTTEVLDELESHLRNEFTKLLLPHTTETVAFENALMRVGKPAALSTEFNKVSKTKFWPVTLIWIAFFVLSAWWDLRCAFNWSDRPLLLVNAVSLLSGYLASYMIDALCLIYILYWRFRTATPARATAIDRAVLTLNKIAIGFVLIGFAFGIAYNRTATGQYWHWHIGEIETLFRLMWLVIFSLILRFGSLSQRATSLLFMAVDLVGNLTLSAAVLALFPDPTRHIKVMISHFGFIYVLQLLGLIMGSLPERNEPWRINHQMNRARKAQS
ncbi:MAG TPA: hypothetical protein VH413_15045 [Verrucomicrobiae bacterium]|nr:hypothetical protein [Verrucomicrobiae bacterium]